MGARRVGLALWDQERPRDLWQERLGLLHPEQLDDPERSRQLLDAEHLIEPEPEHHQPEQGHAGEEVAEDDLPNQSFLTPALDVRLDGRPKRDLERVHVDAGRADGGAGVADQAVRLVPEELGSQRQDAIVDRPR